MRPSRRRRRFGSGLKPLPDQRPLSLSDTRGIVHGHGAGDHGLLVYGLDMALIIAGVVVLNLFSPSTLH
ncbi:MAG: hypothetical protein ABIP46_07190 [Polaromonas sp.]